MSDVTVNPDGGATYASCNAWVSGEAGDQGGALARATCSYSSTRQDTTAVNISGFTNFSQLELIVDSGSRHTGLRGTGYEININTNYAQALLLSDAGAEVRYMEAVNDGATSAVAIKTAAVSNQILEYCIAEGGGSLGSMQVIGNALIRGCLFVNNSGGAGVYLNNYADAVLDNNTVANNSTGIDYGGTGSDPTLNNNVSVGNTTNWNDLGGGLGTGSASYNAGVSGDTIPGSNTITATTSDYANYAGADYGVNSTGSAFYHAGTPISGFTYDFEGDAWDASTPSVGFDEYVVSGGGNIIPINMNGGFKDMVGGMRG